MYAALLFPIIITPIFESVDANGMCRWTVVLPPTMDTNTHMITASSQKYGSVTLSDVLFGDVWVCSGQSNMHFALSQVNNTVFLLTVHLQCLNNTPYSCGLLLAAGRSAQMCVVVVFNPEGIKRLFSD